MAKFMQTIFFSSHLDIVFIPLQNKCFQGYIGISLVCVSVCVQNTSFCQSTGRGIKSQLVTALGPFVEILHNWAKFDKVLILRQLVTALGPFVEILHNWAKFDKVLILRQVIFNEVSVQQGGPVMKIYFDTFDAMVFKKMSTIGL